MQRLNEFSKQLIMAKKVEEPKFIDAVLVIQREKFKSLL